jgi:hypothetical protein
MKTKNWFLLTGLVLSGLVWNGCYTQIARPDREEDTQVARESEPVEEEADQTYSRQESDDDRHVTNVYVYDDWYRPYWYYPAWSWYRYPRSRFYVFVGLGYYYTFDTGGWCGTPWSWYGPRDYYWDPYYYGWHPSYYYDPFYYPRVVYRDRGAEQKKRTITRRGATPVDDNNSAGTYAGSSGRGSLARPVAGTYARGDDGSYRRIRRTEATTADRRSNAPASVSGNNNGNRDDSGRRTMKRSSSGNSGDTGYRRPVSRGNSGSSGDSGVSRRGSSGSSGSGGSVSRPSGNSGSSGRSSPPPSSSGSSGNSGSSDRRKRN